MKFFVGLHQPSDAQNVGPSFISVNRLRTRTSFIVGEWIMDSGAFTTILLNGGYPEPVASYAAEINYWKSCGRLLAAVSQDYMCEPAMVKRTGLSVSEHQRLTIQRYDELAPLVSTRVHLMPVLQGYDPHEYVQHLQAYGDRLASGAWVGVGSVCKRNGNPAAIHKILSVVKERRPDLRLHGFGLKATALGDRKVTSLLHSADSMAWSYAARRNGRNQNGWHEAFSFQERMQSYSL